MKKFLQEFKAFAMRGNIIDMAVGVIIGGAFGKIITSLVNDILMPPIGWLIGGMDFTKLCINLPVREGMDPVTLNYGNFIQVFIDFVIVAFSDDSITSSTCAGNTLYPLQIIILFCLPL